MGKKQERKKINWSVFLGILASLVTIAGFLFSLFFPSSPFGFNRSSPPSLNASPTNSPTPLASFTPSAQILTSYFTQIPGPGCDAGAAKWIYALPSNAGYASCQPHGMLLVSNPNTATFSIVKFLLPGYIFPKNYKVGVMASNITKGACVGMITRKSIGGAAYYLGVCEDGTWFINKIDEGGTVHFLNNGAVQASTSYSITVEAHDDTQGISINNSQYFTITDGTLPSTDGIYLSVDTITDATPNGIGGSALFSYFKFGIEG